MAAAKRGFESRSKEIHKPVMARTDVTEEAFRKIDRSLLALFFTLTTFCCLDRSNLAFAAVQLNEELGFDDVTFGFCSSIYFAGYSLFQVPSNLILLRVGARRWLSILVIVWGFVAMACAFVKGATSFAILRFLLGSAESGTVPGMWWHLRLFYPASRLGVAYSAVGAAFVLSNVLGGPLAAVLMSLDGWMGLSGWQYLFLAEGGATVIFGLFLRTRLADSLDKAPFLRPHEVAAVQRELDADRQAASGGGKGASSGGGVRASVSCCSSSALQWRTWYLGCVALLNSIGKYGTLYWAPLIILSLLTAEGGGVVHQYHSGAPLHSSPHGHHTWAVGLLTGVPYGVVAVATVWNAQHAKWTGDRKRHVAVPMAISGAAFAALPVLLSGQHHLLSFLTLIPATMLWATEGVFMSLPALFLEGSAAATGVAVINTLSNVGGFVGPLLIGVLKERSGGYGQAFAVLAAISLANSLLMLAYVEPVEPRGAGSRAEGGVKPVKIISIALPAAV